MKNIIVLICHYNNLEGLEKSLLSIQEDFPVDVLVVDDGSIQKPNLEHLKAIYKNGTIFLNLLPENVGVGIATNIGLKKIIELGYTLTGRLDCGDINHPNRYKKQLEYLAQKSEIKLLGTWVNMVDMHGNIVFVLKHPTTYKQIKSKMYINNAFMNSASIFYIEILKEVGYFPEKYHRNGEDYAFFFKVIQKYRAENLPEVLLDYEINPNSISSQRRKEQIIARISIIKDHFYFGFYPVFGILRNLTLLFVPQSIIIYLKKKFKK